MIRIIIIFFSLPCLMSGYPLTAQSLTGIQLLEKSIQYHDPLGKWRQFKGELHFEQLNPKQTEQSTRTIWLDRPGQHFKFIQKTGEETIVREVTGDSCRNYYNGSADFSQNVRAQYRLTCERARMYRDYYSYLYGLPMKLQDPGTLIDPLVTTTNFQGRPCYAMRITYDPEVGKDTWYFYFDTISSALIGYRFYHDETQNDGEYITLYGEEIIQGVKMPKNRFWYYNRNDEFLGADFLMPEAGARKEQTLTRADYERAVDLRWDKLHNEQVFNLHVQPHWFEDSTGLWYEYHSPAGKSYQKILLKTLHTIPLFDQQRLADSLNSILQESVEAADLPLRSLRHLHQDTLQFAIKGNNYQLILPHYRLKQLSPTEDQTVTESTSPDGKWIAYVKDYNLYLRSSMADREDTLSTDGTRQYEYASHYGWFDKMEGENGDRPTQFGVNWSPDAKYLQTNICDLRYADKMYLLDWSIDTLYRPRLLSYYRGSPGDTTLVHYIPVFYNIETKEKIPVQLPRNTHINAIRFTWSKDSGKIYAQYAERGFQKVQLLSIDLQNNLVDTLLTETSATNIDNFETWYLEEKDLILFASERSGWRQLYSYHLKSGSIQSITEGSFYVHDIKHLDRERGDIYFTAAGKENAGNPYCQQLYRIGLDGNDLQLLTPEPLHHEISFSKDGKYFFDNFSSATVPTQTVLCDAKTGTVLLKVAAADATALFERGWMPPQTFIATGRDGKTPIYGALWKPTHFDPSRKYPLIDHSYTGPHTQVFPKAFASSLSRNNQALAELGFIVIMVDGMGTAGRSKGFHDQSYKNMGANLTDHVLAIQQLGRRYNWIDTSRIGIFGHSAGGYDAAHALLQFPEVYKVAVASSADHDFRMEKAWWPEMYMGWPVDSTYHQVSNITMAGNLKGKLLLVHGGLDDNVNPSATFKLAEALVRADKEFDLLILPSQRHGYRDQHGRYFIKKRWNYFVEHLLGQKPVWEFSWEQ